MVILDVEGRVHSQGLAQGLIYRREAIRASEGTGVSWVLTCTCLLQCFRMEPEQLYTATDDAQNLFTCFRVQFLIAWSLFGFPDSVDHSETCFT